MNKYIYISVAFLVLLIAFSAEALAQFYSGNQLVEMMRAWERANKDTNEATDYYYAAKYSGFVVGVFDVTRSLYETPGDLTILQIGSIAAKYLKEYPSRWSEPAHALVVDAFEEAFPKEQADNDTENPVFMSGYKIVVFMREYEKMKNGDNSYDGIKASNYVLYIDAAISAITKLAEEAGKSEEYTVSGDPYMEVSEYLKAHPEAWQEPFIGLVLKSLFGEQSGLDY